MISQYFGHYLMPEQSLKLWESQLGTGMWYADDALHCLRQLVEQGSSGLKQLVDTATNNTFALSAHLQGGSNDDGGYLEWLTAALASFEQAFSEAVVTQPSVEVEDEEVIWADSSSEAEAQARRGVPFWATDIDVISEDFSDSHGDGAWKVITRYVLPYR